MKVSPIVLVAHLAALVCGALLLLAAFRDPAPFGPAVFGFEIGSFGPAVAAAGAVAVLYALVYRRGLRAWALRLARGESDERDARAGRIALGALIATGFVLRVARLHEYAFSADEAQFVYFASADTLGDVWRYVLQRSPHPPTNFALLHVLLKVSWEPLWLRLPSVVSGTLLIWLAQRFGRTLFGPAAGLALAVLVTFSPATLYLSSVCRNYAPGFVFLVLASHLLVRHLQTDRWQPLAAFAAVAPLAGIWHYGFVVAFLALALVAGAELLLRRRPWRAWLAVVLAQLPYAATMGFLYFAHISHMSDYLLEFHQQHYASAFSVSAFDLVATFHQVWRYLEISPFAEIFFCAAALGALCLLVTGQRLALLVCVVPPALAYGFSWLGKIPLGATRHSAYLFPFLFGLVASQVPELLSGYRRTRSALRRHLSRLAPARVAPPEAGGGAGLAAAALGAAAVAIFGAAFAGASLLDYGAAKSFDPRDPGSARTELPTWYRLGDVERGFALIEERVAENDLVVLQFQGAGAMRAHYRVTPPDRERPRWARRRERVRKIVRNGITYYYTRAASVTTPATLLEAAERVLAARGLPEPERVWTVQGSWEVPLGQQMRLHFPGVPFDEDVERESNGRVFAMAMQRLRAIGARGSTAEDTEGPP